MELRPGWLGFCAAIAILCVLPVGLSEDTADKEIDADPSALFHTVFPVECQQGYLMWQTIGLYYSFRKVNQRGSFTRLLACAPSERQAFIESGAMDVCPTHVTPSYTNYHKGDHYGPYNMGGTILHWVTHATPVEKFVLILDSDMVLLRPINPPDFRLRDGQGHAAFYGYLKGVNNGLAKRHIPEIAPRKDDLAGPIGRLSDQVGGVQSMTFSDLQKVAPLWLKYTEMVREDPDAWSETGDVYVTKGGKAWISEMYGYSFGCAKAGVWHVANYTVMLYPEYIPSGIPSIMHYGLLFNIGDFKFDKHWYYGFDPLACPPWSGKQQGTTGGVLPPPPHPSALPRTSRGYKRLQHLYAGSTVATLNAGFCEGHRRRCPSSDALTLICDEAEQLEAEYDEAVAAEELYMLELGISCVDDDERCSQWAKSGECEKNPGFMKGACQKSCGICHSSSPVPKKLILSNSLSGRHLPAGSLPSEQIRNKTTVSVGNSGSGGHDVEKPRSSIIGRKSVDEPKLPPPPVAPLRRAKLPIADDAHDLQSLVAAAEMSDRDRQAIHAAELEAEEGETMHMAMILPMTWMLLIGAVVVALTRVNRKSRGRRTRGGGGGRGSLPM